MKTPADASDLARHCDGLRRQRIVRGKVGNPAVHACGGRQARQTPSAVVGRPAEHQGNKRSCRMAGVGRDSLRAWQIDIDRRI